MAVGNDAWLLIVEDDRNACDALAEILRDEGFQVVTAADGDGAIEALERRAFDVVITDLQMPRMDGLQLLREMRARDVSAGTVMMSARGSEAAERQAKLLGALGFVRKPVDVEELLDLVQQAAAPSGTR